MESFLLFPLHAKLAHRRRGPFRKKSIKDRRTKMSTKFIEKRAKPKENEFLHNFSEFYVFYKILEHI